MMSYRPLPTPADLDLGRAWHGDRTDSRGLSGYVGHSTAWLACEHARRHGHGLRDLSREGALVARQSRAEARDTFRRIAGLERLDCEASAKMRLVRQGQRWSNSPAALRSRRERERLRGTRQARDEG